MTAIDFANTVREHLGLPPVEALAGAPADTSPGRRPPLAQALPNVRVYRYIASDTLKAFAITLDGAAAAALITAGGKSHNRDGERTTPYDINLPCSSYDADEDAWRPNGVWEACGA